MITDRQWFTAKHGNTPPYTASVRRQERHYGRPYPVRRSHLGTIAAIFLFASVVLATMLILPSACDYEVRNQQAVAEEGRR
jgi:hypothetical protein